MIRYCSGYISSHHSPGPCQRDTRRTQHGPPSGSNLPSNLCTLLTLVKLPFPCMHRNWLPTSSRSTRPSTHNKLMTLCSLYTGLQCSPSTGRPSEHCGGRANNGCNSMMSRRTNRARPCTWSNDQNQCRSSRSFRLRTRCNFECSSGNSSRGPSARMGILRKSGSCTSCSGRFLHRTLQGGT